MKIGIFGGTFDPPHLGHINMCKEFIEKFSLNKLFVIPANIPPHKAITSNTTANQRLEMTKLAFADLSDKIIVSDIEMKRPGKSYTADTLRFFIDQGYNQLFLLCGTDMMLTIDKWYDPEYIFKNTAIVFARREKEKKNTLLIEEKIKFYENEYGAKIFPLQLDVIEISSTDIRNAINNDKIKNFLTDEVTAYIKLNNLYCED